MTTHQLNVMIHVIAERLHTCSKCCCATPQNLRLGQSRQSSGNICCRICAVAPPLLNSNVLQQDTSIQCFAYKESMSPQLCRITLLDKE